MTSRFTLLFAVAGIATLAGCSAPAEGGGGGAPPPPPSGPPPGLGQGGTSSLGTGGTNQVGVGQGGTAQTGQGGTAQTGQGGTTNAGNAGTTGLPPGDGLIPTGTGLAITPDAEGWVDGMTNGLGIQGAFFGASDSVNTTGTTLTVDTATTAGSVCVSGTLAQIAETVPAEVPVNYQYSTYWGGVVGLNLRQVIPAGGGEAMPASAWSRTTPAGTVSGFGYTITANNGSTLPELRFTVDFVGKAAGDTYCQVIPLGAGSTSLATVVQSCWMAGGLPLPGADLLAIQWSLVPVTTAPTPFDFCISNVTATVGP